MAKHELSRRSFIKKTSIAAIGIPAFFYGLPKPSSNHNFSKIQSERPSGEEYKNFKIQEIKGWKLWNHRNLLSHVLMPYGFSVNIGIKEYTGGWQLKEALVKRGNKEEIVTPGPISNNHDFSELEVEWFDTKFRVQSATDSNNLVIIVSPIEIKKIKTPTLIIDCGFLWNFPGYAYLDNDSINAHTSNEKVSVFFTGKKINEPYSYSLNPYFAIRFDEEIVISSGKKYSLSEARSVIENKKANYLKSLNKYGNLSQVADAICTVVNWNMTYDPIYNRVISSPSRMWAYWNGGYIIFAWDSYFASILAAFIGNKTSAYFNAIEMTNEITKEGFVPNVATATGMVSRDRSFPPVGTLAFLWVYSIFKEKWFLEESFEKLVSWNRWWPQNRDYKGLLCWGSNYYEPVTGNPWEYPKQGVHDRFGASLESGLDNSPMYDDIPFNKAENRLELWDVGLNSLYIFDCNNLAQIAKILGRNDIEKEALTRAEKYSRNLMNLWDEKSGIFKNKRTDNGEFSPKLSPTCFYPLLTNAPTKKQAKRMIEEHFYNEKEFFGDYMMPSISRNDSAFHEQDYWRGRVWGPMNLLTYLALRNRGFEKEAKILAEKSKDMFMAEWKKCRCVFENYNSINGKGDDKENSDRLYVFGGIHGLLSILSDSKLPFLTSDKKDK
ncbi:MAG: trehalase family glycosidase [Cytophagaceae bacterium]|nr:trehalase family glycosidase [Cytophagaceae bacterium]MDW8456463.1 trehalase family glycosidase [Cytophagaceae bacterium]